MKFTYDHRYNIAYIKFHEKTSNVETVKVSDELIVDIAPDGTVYGIELLNANEQLSRDKIGKLLFRNEESGEEVELKIAV